VTARAHARQRPANGSSPPLSALMPPARNPSVSKLDLLDRALTCFATHGLQATSIDDLTTALDVSNRTLYRELGNKAALVEAVYAHATAQLLGDYPAAPQAGETLQAYLGRWWQQTAVAAQADPRAFRYWQFYRTSPHLPAAELVLGPFAALPEMLTHLVAQPGGRRAAEALPLPVLSRWWAAQWTAAVEVVLTDPTCQGRPALGQRVLTQAYSSWWQSLGLAATVLAAKKAAQPTAWDFVLKGAADYLTPTAAPTGIAALEERLKKMP
jgi:AcrR family transcriptional regulator